MDISVRVHPAGSLRGCVLQTFQYFLTTSLRNHRIGLHEAGICVGFVSSSDQIRCQNVLKTIICISSFVMYASFENRVLIFYDLIQLQILVLLNTL